jgi:hypothetical protein
MYKDYEAPKVTLIGRTDELVLGASGCGDDLPHQSAWDFEFEPDWPLI